MAKSKIKSKKKRAPHRAHSNLKRKKKKSKKLLLIKILFLLGLILVFISSACFFYYNQIVLQYLARGEDHRTVMLYADSASFPHRASTSIQTATKVLQLNGYVENNNQQLEPGHFSFDSNRFSIYRREYLKPGGEKVMAKIFDWEIKNQEIPNNPIIELEPTPITPLVTSDYKSKKFIPAREFPKFIITTLVNTEDERFYQHYGIDPIGILRAIWRNLLAGGWLQGGSTLNQQLAKNLFLTPDKTIRRKITEVFVALSLEYNLSKEQILELYLNEVYLGQSGAIAIHGFPAAANFFFNKKIDQITLSEAALLAGIIKAPSYYSPHRHPLRSIERRNLILKKLLENGQINHAEYLNAKNEKIKIIDKKLSVAKAPFFRQTLAGYLDQKFGLNSLKEDSLKIQTTLDLYLQDCAEKATTLGISQIYQLHPNLKTQGLEIGLVSIEPSSGKVKSWVGGQDYSLSQFDHVSQALRQIGSTIKPFIYLAALDQNLNNYKIASPITVLTDEPISVQSHNKQDPWTPQNYDGNFHGAVTLRYALEKSLNLPAVYVSQKIGIKTIANLIKSFNISSQPPLVPSLALGALESNLLKLTAAYAGLANEGTLVSPRLFSSITNENGEIVANSETSETKISSPEATYVLTNILQGVVERGTAATIRKIGYRSPAAGKTGTSDQSRDAWFIGFTPQLATGIWLGLDNNKPINITGGQAAAPIWGEYMKCVEATIKPAAFEKPENVKIIEIDSATGKAYKNSCRGNPIKEVFITGTEPKTFCDGQEYKIEIRELEQQESGFWKELFGG